MIAVIAITVIAIAVLIFLKKYAMKKKFEQLSVCYSDPKEEAIRVVEETKKKKQIKMLGDMKNPSSVVSLLKFNLEKKIPRLCKHFSDDQGKIGLFIKDLVFEAMKHTKQKAAPPPKAEKLKLFSLVVSSLRQCVLFVHCYKIITTQENPENLQRGLLFIASEIVEVFPIHNCVTKVWVKNSHSKW